MGEGRGGVAVMGLRCGDWRGYIYFSFSSFFLSLFISFHLIFGYFFFPGGEFFVWEGSLVICVQLYNIYHIALSDQIVRRGQNSPYRPLCLLYRLIGRVTSPGQ